MCGALGGTRLAVHTHPIAMHHLSLGVFYPFHLFSTLLPSQHMPCIHLTWNIPCDPHRLARPPGPHSVSIMFGLPSTSLDPTTMEDPSTFYSAFFPSIPFMSQYYQDQEPVQQPTDQPMEQPVEQPAPSTHAPIIEHDKYLLERCKCVSSITDERS